LGKCVIFVQTKSLFIETVNKYWERRTSFCVAAQHLFDIVASSSADRMRPAMRQYANSPNVSTLSSCAELSPPPLGGVAKRGFDILGAVAALVALGPLFVLIALLIKLSDGGPVFYGHPRVGRGGRMFRCWKFRTMVTDGDAVLGAYLRADPLAAAEWAATRKLRCDPRITRVGTVLRKLSIDELPQVFNIIVGDMSIVGPRPVVRDELDRYGRSAVFYLRSRPGLTGLWQVSGRNDVSYAARVQFDRHYVENWSLAEDIRIIAKTVPAVCMSRGSY
jgi:exopolysaccharide production protein ExoY